MGILKRGTSERASLRLYSISDRSFTGTYLRGRKCAGGEGGQHGESEYSSFGKVIDYMTFGGLYREVYLEVKEQDSIADIYPMTIPVWKEVVSPDRTGLGKQEGKKAECLEEISGSGVKCKEVSLGKKWKLQSEITLQLHGEKITLNAKNLPDFQEKLSKKGLMIGRRFCGQKRKRLLQCLFTRLECTGAYL